LIREIEEDTMTSFVEVARVGDVPPGTATVARVGDVEIALVNVEGTFFAVDNECTHRGGFLGEGEINTDWSAWAIECPLHGSVFDVRTGEVLNPPAPTPVRTYAVEVEGDVVKVSTD
jgi:3-phenylpropionate/trans-cinnamate dioxygenase ferredoxin component